MAGPTLLATDPREQRLVALYEQAERFIARKINAALASGAKGTATYFENQARSVNRELARLRVQAAPLERAISAAAYATGVTAVEATVDRSTAFSNVHVASVDVLAANLEGRLRYAEEFVGRMVNDTFRRISLEQTGLAMASGLDARSQRVNIERELRRNGITAFVDRRGRRWTLANYSRMVTRTTTREAATVGTTNRLREVGLDLVTIDEHPGSCPICRPLQGRTYSLSGNSRNYPRATALPPIHPNCRHVAYPARASFEEFEKALGLGPDPQVLNQMALGEHEEPIQPEPIVGKPDETLGSDISNRLSVSGRSQAAAPLRSAAAEIEKIHGLPWDTNTAIHGETNNRMRSYGRFTSIDLRPTRKGGPLSARGGSLIEMNTKKQNVYGQIVTAAHEYGHYIDQWALPDGGRVKGSERWARGDDTPSIAPVMKAIADTDSVKALVAASKIRSPSEFPSVGVTPLLRHGHLRYLIRPREQFARAYAQYIAEKSGSPGLLQAVEDDRSFISQRQWTAVEFAPIRAAFDAMFRDLDLLRS